MELKDICTTQETSRKLKEAGFPQEGGIAYWFFPTDYVQEQKWGLVPEYATGQEGEYIRAWTFSELEDILSIKPENPKEFLAELALWAVKEGYLNPKEEE